MSVLFAHSKLYDVIEVFITSEMKLRQSTAEEQIRLLTRSEQNSRDLGAAQEQARILRDQNNALEADKQRLLQEKTDLQSR